MNTDGYDSGVCSKSFRENAKQTNKYGKQKDICIKAQQKYRLEKDEMYTRITKTANDFKISMIKNKKRIKRDGQE